MNLHGTCTSRIVVLPPSTKFFINIKRLLKSAVREKKPSLYLWTLLHHPNPDQQKFLTLDQCTGPETFEVGNKQRRLPPAPSATVPNKGAELIFDLQFVAKLSE